MYRAQAPHTQYPRRLVFYIKKKGQLTEKFYFLIATSIYIYIVLVRMLIIDLFELELSILYIYNTCSPLVMQ